jgi:hypothetical protein
MDTIRKTENCIEYLFGLLKEKARRILLQDGKRSRKSRL